MYSKLRASKRRGSYFWCGFFKHVIEQRAAHESDPALHYWLKILANSGSYGLFVQLDPNEANTAELKVFSGEESFDTTSDVVEEPGTGLHLTSLLLSPLAVAYFWQC